MKLSINEWKYAVYKKILALAQKEMYNCVDN